MPRAIWTGYLSFGLVSVPVALHPATEDRAVRFNQLQRGTSDRIRYRKVNERTGEAVDAADIVRGYDLGGGEYVLVTPEELRAVAPGRSETIDIADFVDLGEIDPVYFVRPYYLAPRHQVAAHAYALLREAIARSHKAAVGTFVLRERQYLVAIRSVGAALALETLRFADEVRDPAELDLPEADGLAERELEAALRLIESLTREWSPERYEDTYRRRVEELVERKREGRAVVTAEPPPAANVVNLMDALEASLARVRAGAPAARERPRAERATEGLAALRKADLAARAAELGIEGRSRMTKEQLVEAVASATASRRRARKVS
ncbi:MAG TPA: Ku protein [Acidimicrobiales bacterium]|nr:Ku protein [Acidimicrobiales bacterium]